jgi:hypothetical protein
MNLSVDQSSLRRFIEAAPNLEVLTIMVDPAEFNEDDFEFIVRNALNLKKLTMKRGMVCGTCDCCGYRADYGEDLSRFVYVYENLQDDDDEDEEINRNINLIIENP